MRQVRSRCSRLLACLPAISTAVFALSGCGADGGSSPPSPQYSLGGSVSGLSGSGLQLQNGSSKAPVSANGGFTFPTQFAAGTSYSVTVATQPSSPAQTCTIANGSGTFSASVTSVSVQCTTKTYQVGGIVAGLVGSGLVLQNEGGDSLAVSANGVFTFATSIASGAPYAVTVSSPPSQPDQACTVGSGTGIVGASNVSSVQVTCSTLITYSNAMSVSQLGNTTSETLLQFASFMGERLNYLSAHLAASVTESCSDLYHEITAGTATYTFTDNDGSGTLTPGDTVGITLAGCYSQSMAEDVSGTVTLTLVAPSNPPQSGTVYAANATLATLQLLGLTVSGSLTSQYSAADTLYSVQTSVGPTPVTFSYPSGGIFRPDTVLVSNTMVSKAIDYTIPRYSVQIASTFQSQALQGQFSITTPTALSGRLNVYPDTGMEVFTGGGSVLQYAAQNVPDNENVAASLDATGSGTFTPVIGLFWEQGIDGFPWWEPRGFSNIPVNSLPSYSTLPLSQWGMQLLFTEPQAADPVNGILSTGMDVDTPIKLFFNAPVDTTTDAFTFNTATYLIPGQVAIPAAVSANGPILSLTPQSQLQHGERYQLVSTNRVATTWSTTGGGASVNFQVTTLNTLQANASPSPGVAAPGQSVQLNSGGSFSSNSTIAGYAWAQTAGTPATLSNANTATASFIVPAAAPGGSALQFTLTVTDANGETDSVPVTVFVLTNLQTPFAYYRAQQVPSVGQTAENATLESPLSGSVSTVFDTTYDQFKFIFSGSSLYDQIYMGPSSVPIVPGSYSSSSGNPNFFNVISLMCDAPPNWKLVIHEAVAASDGTAQTFSADFTYQCPTSNAPAYSGSVRVNSTWPLP
jgi:hypothetical protein